MSIMHIMPEAVATYEGYAKCAKLGENPFPLPYLLYLVGYVFILIIDRWLAAAYHLEDNSGNGIGVGEVKIHAPEKTQIISLKSVKTHPTLDAPEVTSKAAFEDE